MTQLKDKMQAAAERLDFEQAPITGTNSNTLRPTIERQII